MLCDQFDEFLRSQNGRGFPEDVLRPFQYMRDQVQGVPRYNLDRAAVMMIQNITLSKPSTFLKALPLCRLPAPTIWVEFVFKDRSDWLAAAQARDLVDPAYMDTASPPSRMGFLLREIEVGGEPVVEVNGCWSHGAGSIEVCWKHLLIATVPNSSLVTKDLLEAVRKNLTDRPEENFSHEMKRHVRIPNEMDAAIQLEARFSPQIPEYWRAIWDSSNPTQKATMHRQGDYDLLSEWRFVMALLATLNSRNIIKYEDVEDYTPLNRKRAKAGKAALLSHRPITINLSKVQRRRVMNYLRDKGERKRPDDPQFVMGHLKLRRTGVFWWCPHSRYGNDAKPRDYQVTA